MVKLSQKKVTIHQDVDLETLAYQLVFDTHDNEAIEAFVLRVDELMEDYDFSMSLLRNLAKSLEGEGVEIQIKEEHLVGDD